MKVNNPFPMVDFSIKNQSLPKQIIVPIFDTTPVVAVGDKVLTGQVLAVGTTYTHSSISGEVIGIGDEFIPHPSGLKVNCIKVVSDGLDKWVDLSETADFLLLSSEQIMKKIDESGIVGLGGAGFASNVKLKKVQQCSTILINACECEPAIEADNTLMRLYPKEVLSGVDILLHLTKAQKAIIVIEDDKEAVFKSFLMLKNNPQVEIIKIATTYGSGSEKVLINNILGIKITSGKFASDYGILLQNVATTKAIFDYVVKGVPLLARIVTVVINNIPQNLVVRIGTLINEITNEKVRLNGLMMGFDLSNNNYPIVKTTNAIFPQQYNLKLTRECIRCGDCAEVCPSGLLPQQIYWFAKNENIEKCLDYNVMDCTLCRCCDEVCGSNIPLSSYFTFVKRKNLANIEENKQEKISSERFEFRQYRLQRNKQERIEMMARKRKEIQEKMQKQKQTNQN